MAYIGLEGSGNEEELTVVRETAKAYLVRTEANEEVWLPKSVFSDDGSLFPYGEKLLEEKLEELGK